MKIAHTHNLSKPQGHTIYKNEVNAYRKNPHILRSTHQMNVQHFLKFEIFVLENACKMPAICSGLNVLINTLRPRQNCRHFTDIFKRIFLNENIWISLKILLKFVPKVPINNIPALVQIMAWRRPGNKPSEPMMVIYWYIYTSLSLDEWNLVI